MPCRRRQLMQRVCLTGGKACTARCTTRLENLWFPAAACHCEALHGCLPKASPQHPLAAGTAARSRLRLTAEAPRSDAPTPHLHCGPALLL
eukprot:365040-Chlamydomonas_euryale.AAC.11